MVRKGWGGQQLVRGRGQGTFSKKLNLRYGGPLPPPPQSKISILPVLISKFTLLFKVT